MIVSASAATEELQRRLERRGGDASEADVAVLRFQLEHADALDEDERDNVIEIVTDEPVDLDSISILRPGRPPLS